MKQREGQQWWSAARTPGFFFLAAAASLIVLAILGARQVNSINEENTTIRIDRAGRTAAALVTAHVPESTVVKKDGVAQPEAIQIDTALLEPSPEWDDILDQLSRINDGAANLFRFSPETGSFDRLSTTFRNEDGSRVGGSQVEPGLIQVGHPSYDTVTSGQPFVGEVPVAGRQRLAYLTPLLADDLEVNGILAVDVGFVDDVERVNAENSGKTIVTTMIMLALFTLLSLILMIWSFRPLHQLSRVAHALGTDEDPDGIVNELAERDDEIGYLAQGLSKVRELRERLEHQAFSDSLTEIANRAAIVRELERRFENGTHDDPDAATFTLMILDLDGFKRVNDGLGHQAGDELLIHVSQQLRDCLHPGEFVGRLGGDEFAVMSKTNAVQKDAVKDLAERLKTAASGSVQTAAGEAHVTLSIGVAISPQHGGTMQELMKNADLALYEVKRNGRSQMKIYEPRLAESFNRQTQLLPELRKAIKDKGIDVAFQPIYSATGNVAAVETLARWTHPTEGSISPEEFIPVAEGSGLINGLSWVVFEKACQQITEWTDTHDFVPVITVNVSTIQLRRPNFVASMARLFERYPAARGHLSLELTESFAVTDQSGWHRPVLAKLHELGVLIAIDDFGTGYSTLSYLRDLNVDVLKIDQSFITSAAKSPEQESLLNGIVSLGKGLGLRVILEGIETPEELVVAQSMEFDGLQGFLLGEPMGGAEVAKLFDTPHPLLTTGPLSKAV